MAERGVVDVWALGAASFAQCARLAADVLSEEERKRAERLVRAEDREQFRATHVQLRLLGSQLGLGRPESIRIERGDFGRPAFVQPECEDRLHFSLSHTRGLTVYAFAWGQRVGIDVEGQRTIPFRAAIARRIFSAEEAEEYDQVPEPDQERAFFNGWTRKEALLKAVGIGLTGRMDEVVVSLDPRRTARVIRLGSTHFGAGPWSIHELAMPDGFVAALAVEGDDVRVRGPEWLG